MADDKQRIEALFQQIWNTYVQESNDPNKAVSSQALSHLLASYRELTTTENLLDAQDVVQKNYLKLQQEVFDQLSKAAKEAVSANITNRNQQVQETLRRLGDAQNTLMNAKLADHKTIVAMLGSFKGLAILLGGFGVDVQPFISYLDQWINHEKAAMKGLDTKPLDNLDTSVSIASVTKDYAEQTRGMMAQYADLMSSVVPALYKLQPESSLTPPPNGYEVAILDGYLRNLPAGYTFVLPKGMGMEGLIKLIDSVSKSEAVDGILSLSEANQLTQILKGEFQSRDGMDENKAAQSATAIMFDLIRLNNSGQHIRTAVGGVAAAGQTANQDIDMAQVKGHWNDILKQLTNGNIVVPAGKEGELLLVIDAMAKKDGQPGSLSQADQAALVTSLVGFYTASGYNDNLSHTYADGVLNALKLYPVTTAAPAPQQQIHDVTLSDIKRGWSQFVADLNAHNIPIPPQSTANELLKVIEAAAKTDGNVAVLSADEIRNKLKNSLNGYYLSNQVDAAKSEQYADGIIAQLQKFQPSQAPQQQASTLKTIDLKAIEDAAKKDPKLLSGIHPLPSLTPQELFNMTKTAATTDGNNDDITGREQQILFENIRDALVKKGIDANIAANDAQQFVADLRQLSP